MEPKETIDMFTVSITIGIAVFGWLISLLLQRKNLKDQHRIQVKYDIYKEFVLLRKEAQDAINKLAGHASSPFILMSSSMIPFELKLTKEYKGTWIPYSEQECLFEGEQKWTSSTRELYDLYFDFSNKLLNVLYLTEDWASPLKEILPTKQIFHEEVQKLKKNIQENLSTLQSYPQTHGHDWRSWDKEKAEAIIRSIGDDSMSVGMYLSDFMVLIHNELLSSYFGHKRPIRKTLDKKYKVLTKNGIIENVDWKLVKKTDLMTTDLIAYAKKELAKYSEQDGHISEEYKNFLTSVASGICPNCTTPILVMNMEKTENSFCYQYACGHSFKGISLHETITIRDLIKVKKFDELLGKIRTIVQGWKPSGDKQIKDGVNYYMDVNKERNEYHQVVKDYQTGEVLHEEHELLTDHKTEKNNA